MTSEIIFDMLHVYYRCFCDMFGRFFLFFQRIPLVDDKAVLITGCDSGFGHVTALKLNESGFTVFAGCLFPDKDGAMSLKRTCKHGQRMHLIPLNVTEESSILSAKEAVDHILDQNHLKLWAVVNNAGIVNIHEFEWGSFDLFRSVFEVNVFGMALVTRTFLPLVRQCQGRIININSVVSRFGSAQLISYGMSKAASLSFVEGLRREMFKFGVKVISIEPFMYRTNITLKTENIKSSIEKAWDETDPNIKNVFGDQYLQTFVSFFTQSFSNEVNRDPIEVANEVDHAVTAIYPKMNYTVARRLWRFLFFWVPLIHPQEILEIAFNLGQVVMGFHKTYGHRN